MLTITLLCNFGMSTSLLVEKIVAAANKQGLEVDVDALPFDKVGDRINKTDVLLLGLQVRYLTAKFKKDYGETIPVIETINMTDYALLNGEKILKDALANYEANKH